MFNEINTIPPKGRLLGIDSLRGIAALGVVLFHVYRQLNLFDPPVVIPPESLFKTIIGAPLGYGYTGVFLFFVISGFCIHLKATKSKAGGGDFTIDFIPFWKRRIRRLYPAYLAALVIYLFAMWYVGRLQFTPFLIWDTISHLLMLHNLDIRTAYSINGVFWSLAVEEQLYLAYFLLIWLRKRYGWTKTIFICIMVRVAWFAVALALRRFFDFYIPVKESAAANWFIWALGAVSVEWVFGLIKLPSLLRSRLLAAIILIGAASITYVDQLRGGVQWSLHSFIILILYPMWGIGFFIVVNYAASYERYWRTGGTGAKIVALLAGVGVFSYSLYIIHELVYTIVVYSLMPSLSFLAVPLALASAWVFFQVFEKPFLSPKDKHDIREVELRSVHAIRELES